MRSPRLSLSGLRPMPFIKRAAPTPPKSNEADEMPCLHIAGLNNPDPEVRWSCCASAGQALPAPFPP